MSYLLDENPKFSQSSGIVRLPPMPRLVAPNLAARPSCACVLFGPGQPPPRLLRPIAAIFGGSAPALLLPPYVSSTRSSCPLDSLLVHWPQLQLLVVCGQLVVRSSSLGGQPRLVMPAATQQ